MTTKNASLHYHSRKTIKAHKIRKDSRETQKTKKQKLTNQKKKIKALDFTVKRVQLQDAGHSANSLKYIFQTSVCEYKITNIKIRHFNTSNFLFSQVYKPQVLKLSEKWHPFLQNYFTLSTTPNSKLPGLQHLSVCSLDFLQFCAEMSPSLNLIMTTVFNIVLCY